MSDGTKIQWTNSTWSPTIGCRRISPGCGDSTGGGCYAEGMALRITRMHPGSPYARVVRRNAKGEARWTGNVVALPERLSIPLGWRAGRRIFVDSMSDLFHEDVSNEFIAAVFGVMAACPQHVFQLLTKRAERMAEWFRWIAGLHGPIGTLPVDTVAGCMLQAARHGEVMLRAMTAANQLPTPPWPLPNVHVGVSVEDQARADERIPHLLSVPAAVRWLSVEPQLGPVDVAKWLTSRTVSTLQHVSAEYTAMTGMVAGDKVEIVNPGISWVVQGGESGKRARPFNIAWARSLRDQCKAAGVAYFLKQLGKDPRGCLAPNFDVGVPAGTDSGCDGYDASECAVPCPGGRCANRWVLRDSHGGDMDEWPEDLRIREWPDAPGPSNVNPKQRALPVVT